MLTVDQLTRRAARELESGLNLRPSESLPTELRASIVAELGVDAIVVSAASTADDLRVICRLGVIDIATNAWTLREVPPGISAAEVQKRVRVPLLCRPDLAEVRVD